MGVSRRGKPRLYPVSGSKSSLTDATSTSTSTSTSTLSLGAPPVEFSVAHTGQVWAVAISRGVAVGLDLERRNPERSRKRRYVELARRYFHPLEAAAVAAIAEAETETEEADMETTKAGTERQEMEIGEGTREITTTAGKGKENTTVTDTERVFTQIWTMKEAVVKAAGRGIAAYPGFKGFCVHLGPPLRLDFATRNAKSSESERESRKEDDNQVSPTTSILSPPPPPSPPSPSPSPTPATSPSPSLPSSSSSSSSSSSAVWTTCCETKNNKDVSEERVVEDPYDDWDDAFHHTAFFLRGPLHEEPWLVSKQDDPCHHFPEDDAATTITAALVVRERKCHVTRGKPKRAVGRIRSYMCHPGEWIAPMPTAGDILSTSVD